MNSEMFECIESLSGTDRRRAALLEIADKLIGHALTGRVCNIAIQQIVRDVRHDLVDHLSTYTIWIDHEF